MKRILLNTVSALAFTAIATQGAHARDEVATYTTSIAVGEENPNTHTTTKKKLVKAKLTNAQIDDFIKSHMQKPDELSLFMETHHIPLTRVMKVTGYNDAEISRWANNSNNNYLKRQLARTIKTPPASTGPVKMPAPITPIKNPPPTIQPIKAPPVTTQPIKNPPMSTQPVIEDTATGVISPAKQPTLPVVPTTPGHAKLIDDPIGPLTIDSDGTISHNLIAMPATTVGKTPSPTPRPMSPTPVVKPVIVPMPPVEANPEKAGGPMPYTPKDPILTVGGSAGAVPGYGVKANGDITNPNGVVIGHYDTKTGVYTNQKGKTPAAGELEILKKAVAANPNFAKPVVKQLTDAEIDDFIKSHMQKPEELSLFLETNHIPLTRVMKVTGYNDNEITRWVQNSKNQYLIRLLNEKGQAIIDDGGLIHPIKQPPITNPEPRPGASIQPVDKPVTIALPPAGQTKALSNGNTIDGDGYVKNAAGQTLGRVLDNGTLLNASGTTVTTAAEKSSLIAAAGGTGGGSTSGATRTVGGIEIPVPTVKNTFDVNAATEAQKKRYVDTSYYGNNDDLSAEVANVRATLATKALMPKPKKGETFAIGGTGYKVDSSGILFDPYGSARAKYNFSTGAFTQLDGKPFTDGSDRHYSSLYESVLSAQKDAAASNANVKEILENLQALHPSDAAMDKFKNDPFYSGDDRVESYDLTRISMLFLGDLRKQVAEQYNQLTEAQQREYDQALLQRSRELAQKAINGAVSVAKAANDPNPQDTFNKQYWQNWAKGHTPESWSGTPEEYADYMYKKQQGADQGYDCDSAMTRLSPTGSALCASHQDPASLAAKALEERGIKTSTDMPPAPTQ